MLQIQNIEIDETLVISLIALIISIVALYYTVVTFLLKSGHKIRCDITTSSTIDCDDKYISNITLENLKDRASVIFAIYLKLGRGNYILIESFEDEPLILKPFEVYHKAYDPILIYSSSSKRVKIDNLLSRRELRKKILLSTTDGKYLVKTSTKKWEPIPLFFKNYTTVIVHPNRLSYKGKDYGKNVKYLVELIKSGNKDIVIPLRERDYQIKVFTKFRLTKECLETKLKLEEYLNDQKQNGNLSFDEIKIVDFKERVSQILNEYGTDPEELVERNYFQYNILGRIYTFMENRRLRRKNNELKKQNDKKNTTHNNE